VLIGPTSETHSIDLLTRVTAQVLREASGGANTEQP